LAGLLRSLLRQRLLTKTPSQGKLAELLRNTNAVGALTTTKKGAIPALPTLKDVLQFLIRSNNSSNNYSLLTELGDTFQISKVYKSSF
jgi:hypothetical protein